MRSILLASAIFFSSIGAAHAYVGPGLGLGAIGAIIGTVFAIVLAIVGLVWYPMKRILKKPKASGTPKR